jgi:hypothetical protein
MTSDGPSVTAPNVQQHLEQTVRTWIGIPANARQDVPQLPDRLARLLLRVEEHEQRHRDQFNCWEFSYSENYWRGRLWVPEVDEWVAEKRRQLKGQIALAPLWPGGHPFAVCMTHDVDMISRHESPAQAARALRIAISTPPGNRDRARDRALRAARSVGRSAHFGISRLPSASESLGRCIEVGREYGVASSYFFTVYPPRPAPVDCAYKLGDACALLGARATVADVARRICAEGSDVGLHASYLSALDAGLLAQEKATLEQAVGQPVETVRQHYLHFDARITPLVQQRAGFVADTTLGFNRNIGFRAGTSMPFRPFDFKSGAPLTIIEVPLVIQEAPLLRANALELDAELGKRAIRQLLDAVEAVGGAATILFHPHSLIESPHLELYRFTIEYGLERGAWLTSVARIAEWWRAREQLIVGDRGGEPAEPAR